MSQLVSRITVRRKLNEALSAMREAKDQVVYTDLTDLPESAADEKRWIAFKIEDVFIEAMNNLERLMEDF